MPRTSSHTNDNSKKPPPPGDDPRDRLPGLKTAWERLPAIIKHAIEAGLDHFSILTIVHAFRAIERADPSLIEPRHVAMLLRFFPRWRDEPGVEEEVERLWHYEPRSGAGNGADDAKTGPRESKAPPPEEPSPTEPKSEDEAWPEPMALAAFHGPIGEAVGEMMPHTEADKHGILVQSLVYFGNRIGRGPYYQINATKHATNLYTLIIGETAEGRKGLAEGLARQLFQFDASDNWAIDRIRAGLSSGEGLIHAVRDEQWIINKKSGEQELADAGVKDKRLTVVETEFASVLSVAKREGNTLSPILRVAWDRGELETITRNNPIRTTNALISLIGHITPAELRFNVTRTELANGLLNRFLFVLVRRQRSLPHGGDINLGRLRNIALQLGDAVRAARSLGQIGWTSAAYDLWSATYGGLGTKRRGLVRDLTGRAEPQTARLAMLYALASQAAAIDCKHLEAALAVWRYCQESAAILFTDRVGDPLADLALALLKEVAPAGMTSTELLRASGNNARLHLVLDQLERDGYVRRTVRIIPHLRGKSAKVWTFIPPDQR